MGSLLTAAAVPVLLAWILVYNRKGTRWRKFAAFSTAAVMPFAPVFRLFWLGPRETWFNLVQYHATFRKLYWPETTSHDLDVLTSWINSGPALVLGLLAVLGLLYVMRGSQWPQSLKAEFYLCGWLAVGIAAELAIVNNFIWNDYWIFSDISGHQRQPRQRLRRFAKFQLICLGGLALNTALLKLQFNLLGMNRYLANAIAIAAVTGWNFYLNLKLSWRVAEPEQTPAT